jgi:hypothetical protein
MQWVPGLDVLNQDNEKAGILRAGSKSGAHFAA